MDLDDLIDHVGQRLGAVDLGDGALGGVFLDPLLVLLIIIVNTFFDGGQFVVEQTGKAVDEGFGGKKFGLEVGDFFADSAEFADLNAKLLAFVGVLDADFQGVFSGAGDGRAKFEASDIEDIEGDFVPLADFAQNVFYRHLAVIEDDLSGRGALDTHLLFFIANNEPVKGFLDQKGGEFLFIDLGKNGVNVSK